MDGEKLWDNLRDYVSDWIKDFDKFELGLYLRTFPKRISVAGLRHKVDCTPEGRINVCHGRCCRGARYYDEEVSIYESEDRFPKEMRLRQAGKLWYVIHDEEQPLCPFIDVCLKDPAYPKPVQCSMFPLKVNDNGTLILSTRWVCLNCPNHGKGDLEIWQAIEDDLVEVYGQPFFEVIRAVMEDGISQKPLESIRAMIKGELSEESFNDVF